MPHATGHPGQTSKADTTSAVQETKADWLDVADRFADEALAKLLKTIKGFQAAINGTDDMTVRVEAYSAALKALLDMVELDVEAYRRLTGLAGIQIREDADINKFYYLLRSGNPEEAQAHLEQSVEADMSLSD